MKKTQYSKLKLGAAPLVLGVALVSAPAYAQDEGATSSSEIVVTGTLIRNPNLESASPVTAIGADEIDMQQAAGREQMPIVVSLQRDGARLALAVRDHGNGLDLEAQGRLFEPFFTTKPDGLGLGLSICKTIAEAHGGELSADIPADGPGLCLWLRLPCLENPPA